MNKKMTVYFVLFIFAFILTGCGTTREPIKLPPPEFFVSPINSDFLELYQENNDLVFLLRLADGSLSVPIMQTKNNSDYLRSDFYNTYSVFGTPFVDYRVDLDTGQNIVIYGHSTIDGKLFGKLTQYKNIESIYNKIILKDKSSVWEYTAFSVFEQEIYGKNLFDFTKSTFTEKEFKQFVSTAKELSAVPCDTSIDISNVLTLVTCENSTTDRRLVVMAYLNSN